jgi:hypothetical protein
MIKEEDNRKKISNNKTISVKEAKLKEFRNLFSVYKIKNLSFSFFISNLIYHIVNKPINDETELWFPVDKEKEKLFDISLGVQNDQ